MPPSRKPRQTEPVIFGGITLQAWREHAPRELPAGPVLAMRDFLDHHLDQDRVRDGLGFPSPVEPRPSYRLKGRDGEPVVAREHLHRQDLVRTALDLLARTRTGADVIEALEGRPIVIAIDPSQEKGYAVAYKFVDPESIFTSKGDAPCVIGLSKDGRDAKRANMLYHELRHVQQQVNHDEFQRQGHHYPNKLRGFGDRGYHTMVTEADTYGHMTINALELSRLGPGTPFASLFGDFQAQLPARMNSLLAEGHVPTSGHVKQALFDTWMTGSPELRRWYELKEARTASQDTYPMLSKGVTDFATDLAHIAREKDGTSYLDAVDLKRSDYLGAWASIGSHQDLAEFIAYRRQQVDADHARLVGGMRRVAAATGGSMDP